jgi:RecA-family ATPase
MTEPVKLVRLADVEPETVDWLWQGRIPVGKLVTLDGDPGLGKSTLTTDISATVTTGGAWPDGSQCHHPGAVLLMSAEDGLSDTIRPRAGAAGADLTKVHAVEGISIVNESGEVTLRPPTLEDIAALEHAIIETGARLLVIDVVMAYLPTGTDSHRDQDVRRILSRLSPSLIAPAARYCSSDT